MVRVILNSIFIQGMNEFMKNINQSTARNMDSQLSLASRTSEIHAWMQVMDGNFDVIISARRSAPSLPSSEDPFLTSAHFEI